MDIDAVRARYKRNPRTVVNLTATATPAVALTAELTPRGFLLSVYEIGQDTPLQFTTWGNPMTLNQCFIDWGYRYDVEAWK